MNRHARIGRLVMRIRPAFLAVLAKRLLAVRRLEIDTPEGRFWVDPASYLGLRLLDQGAYEAEMLATLDRWLHPGDTFVDVGANEGYFSVAAARRVGGGGRVLAVEPQSRLVEVLRRNFSLNGCTQVQLAVCAVSDRPGQATLHLTPGVNNSASSLLRPTRYPWSRQRVPCATLREILGGHGVSWCDLVKIDIEGWEYEAILGSQRWFREGRAKAIALELHPHILQRRGLEADAITRFLGESGYTPQAGAPTLVFARNQT